MDALAQVFFDYLRDLLYDPDVALGHVSKVGAGNENLAAGMEYFAACLKETRVVAGGLAKGNLTVPDVRADNELAAPLKQLHAALKHVTWQTQQAAKGDYKQQVDFMGEFSDAFNTMVKQLDDRQKALETEMEQRLQRFLALEQSNSLLEALTDNIPQWIIVMDRESCTVLFTNDTAENVLRLDHELAVPLQKWLKNTTERQIDVASESGAELVMASDQQTHYFKVVSYPLQWKARNAVAHVFTDVSDEKSQVQKLQDYVYQDTLTRIYNRLFGMQVLKEWVESEKQFSISFADLDDLKSVNDNYGHREGDRYIIRAAEKLVSFSEDAVVARLGGDEFMVLAPGYTRAQCDKRMSEIREELIQQSTVSNKAYCTSISFGTVEVGSKSTMSSSELLALADERMYRHKRANKSADNNTRQRNALQMPKF